MDEKKEAGLVTDSLLFIQMVSMFQAAAMQHLGKVMNPVTNKIERDLDQAKISIDIVGMIKNKTKSNLSEEEEAFLDKVLFELRMNYVEEVEKSKRKAEVGEDGRGGEKEAERDEGPPPEEQPKEPRAKTKHRTSKSPGAGGSSKTRAGGRKKSSAKGVKKKI